MAIATLMIAYIQHTCGMFKITWYEIKYEIENLNNAHEFKIIKLYKRI